MKIVDGQVVLTSYEEIEASIAEDDLQSINDVVLELFGLCNRIQRLRDNEVLTVPKEDVRGFRDILSDSVADLFSKDWDRLVKKAHTIAYPTRVPGLETIAGDIA